METQSSTQPPPKQSFAWRYKFLWPMFLAVNLAVGALELRESIPEDQQGKLFKWILEEKRKIKPKDPEEKKRIDEGKATMKQFIQAKPIPSI